MGDFLLIGNISQRLYSWTHWWSILIVLALFGLAHLLIAIFGNPILNSITFLDVQLIRTPAKLFSTVDAYTQSSQAITIFFYIIIDLIVPILYTLLLCLSISWILKRTYQSENKHSKLNVIPIIGGTFDVLENWSIIALVLIHPSEPLTLAYLSSLFTVLKFITIKPIFTLLLLVILVSIKKQHSKNIVPAS